MIRDRLKERGWTQGDLAEIMGRPERLISELIAGKKEMTAQTALGLAKAFGDEDALYWKNLDNAYLLATAEPVDESVGRRATLYSLFPVREMLKRDWIKLTGNVRTDELRFCAFFGIKTIGDKLRFFAEARTGQPNERAAVQAAWLYRVRELAATVRSCAYSDQKLQDALPKLRTLLSAPEEIRQVPRILAEAGVRFLIVETLPGANIDGAAFWLDEKPVIALSLRIDQLNNFWFLLLHEIVHILRHGMSVQVELIERILRNENISPEEGHANYVAADFLAPIDRLSTFMRTGRPYSEQGILSFAQRMAVHPAIIVGQLQFCREIPDTRFRKHSVKVREIITPESLTDGWGAVAYAPRWGA
jgi:HTH-type transcriptional regulator/antitoxin HigA